MRRLAMVALLVLFAPALFAQSSPADYGSAPAPYPACEHIFTTIPAYRWTCLGSRVSDDSAGANPVPGGFGADEDRGVVPSTLSEAGGYDADGFVLMVYCFNAVQNVDCIGIWIDFNDNGSWDDPGEQVVYAVAGGRNQIPSQPDYNWFGAGISSFHINIPNNVVGATARVRARVWNGVLSGGVFALGQGMGSPHGTCIGGECEDHEFAYFTDPQIGVTRGHDRHGMLYGSYLASGDTVDFNGLQLNAPNPYYWAIMNIALGETTSELIVSSITVSDEIDCAVVFVRPPELPLSLHRYTNFYAGVMMEVTPSAPRCSFTVTIISTDPDESPFVFHVQGYGGLTGTYIVDNTPGANADFADIGEAFDKLEEYGIAASVVFEVRAGIGPYQSNSSYGLGLVPDLEAETARPVTGIHSNRTVTFRAAAGHKPKITGNGVRLRYGDFEYQATIAIGVSSVTLEGFEISGGRDFGVVVQKVNWLWADAFTLRRCQVHGISQGPGLFFVSWMSSPHGSLRVDGNFFWDCGTSMAHAPATEPWRANDPSFNLLRGVVSIYGHTRVYMTHNTIYANGPQPSAGEHAACISIIRNSSIELKGNILSQKNGGQPLLYCHYAATDIPGTSDNNCFHASAGGAVAFIGETSQSVTTLPAWQAGVRDFASIAADPRFVRAQAPVNLHLRTSSPCVDAYQSAATGVDIDSEPRPQRGGWDIGADEVPPDPDMLVSRSGNAVPNGSTDDYGGSIPANMAVDFSYTITNNGVGPLLLAGVPRVVLTTIPGVTATLIGEPPASIAPSGQATLTVRVISVTGAARVGFSIATNDPRFDPYEWELICDTAPTIEVSCRGSAVGLGQVLSFPWGTTIESLNLLLSVRDANVGQHVSLQATVSGGGPLGLNLAQWSSSALPAPYDRLPTTGTLNITQGSTHLVTLVADDGFVQTYFTFTIRGEPAITLMQVRDGFDGPVITSGSPATGTNRSFAVRDIKSGASPSIHIVLENIGDIPVEVGAPQLSGIGYRDFRATSSGYVSVVPTGGRADIYISFDPVDVGQRTAVLELYHGATNQPAPFVLLLEGEGVDVPPLEITSAATLPGGRTGQEYAPVTLGVAGGYGPYLWVVVTGSLPEGLVLHPSGMIHGAVTAGPGLYKAGIRVRDALGNDAMREFEIRVQPALPRGALPGDGLAGRDAGATCASGDGSPAPWVLLLLPLLWLLARFRRGDSRPQAWCLGAASRSKLLPDRR